MVRNGNNGKHQFFFEKIYKYNCLYLLSILVDCYAVLVIQCWTIMGQGSGQLEYPDQHYDMRLKNKMWNMKNLKYELLRSKD
jgi:hypothetical protein